MPRLLLLLPVLVLSACSSVQLAYRNADWLLVSYADDFVDLRESQEEAWEPLVEAALVQHREQELPALVALLASAETGVKRGLGHAGLECLRVQGRAAVARNAEMIAALAAPLLAELDPAQIEHLREHLAERDQEYVEKHLDPDPVARHEARVERFVRRIERWTGRLGPQQRALVDRHVSDWPDLAPGWAEYRRERQRALFALLGASADEATLQAFLAGWWGRQAGMAPDLREARHEAETGLINLLVELQDMLDNEQQRQLADSVGDVRRSLASLVPEAAVTAALRDTDCTSTDRLAAST